MTKQFLDELRKGNLIEWQHDLKNDLWIHSRVKEILDEHVVFVNGEKVHYSRVRPWVLTEKILEGYAPDWDNNVIDGDGDKIFFIPPLEVRFVYQDNMIIRSELQYRGYDVPGFGFNTHELQNLYLDLTKKQLRFLNDKED